MQYVLSFYVINLVNTNENALPQDNLNISTDISTKNY